MKKNRVVELDVREDLKNKREPFQKIMNVVKTLQEGDQFILHATFKPTPLLTLLKAKGFQHELEQRAADHWVVTFTKKRRKFSLSNLFGGKKTPEKPRLSSPPAQTMVDDEEIAQSVEKDLKREGKVYRLDNRGLEPPKPMMRTLHQLSRMKPGESLIITNERVPVFLFEELQQLGYDYQYEQVDENTVHITITKK
ncbi:putative universal stress protein [Caldalkalibacillus thermarum TA2.A1]|nr:DUF2249 domain-containing protein [Caldalkalibacillus thermarum]EGL83290.1 putative universal stress protein [Caldalkalibacillus thermarum TA2.A1]